MKNFKFSMLAMLSVIAMTFTSCLGDGDNTQYVMGIGTAGVSSSSSVQLDNGLTLNSASFKDVASGSRVYVYASVDGEEYETAVNNLNAGKSGTVTLQSLYDGGVCVDCKYDDKSGNFDAELEETVTSDVESFNWCRYGAFGNGWMNFTMKADWYLKKIEGSSDYDMVAEMGLWLKTFDREAKKVELVFLYDNKESEALKEGSATDLKDGYQKIAGYQSVSADVSALYGEMINGGLKDEDEIELSVRFVRNKEHELSDENDALSGKLDSSSTNYCTVGMFKRRVGGYY